MKRLGHSGQTNLFSPEKEGEIKISIKISAGSITRLLATQLKMSMYEGLIKIFKNKNRRFFVVPDVRIVKDKSMCNNSLDFIVIIIIL